MRPILWMFRLGLFAAGFGMGLTHWHAGPPVHRILIEVQTPRKDSSAPRVLEPTAKPAIPPDCPASSLQTAANFAFARNGDRASD